VLTLALHMSRRLVALLTAVTVAAGFLTAANIPSAAASPPTGPAIADNIGCAAHALPPNDDGSTGSVALPFKLNFYNHTYTSLYVNNNGNVTFQAPMSTFTPFNITANIPPMIAPFFADVDTRGPLSFRTSYGATTFEGRPAFCVNWRHVGYYAERADKTNTFQLIIVNDNPQGDFDIVFDYGSIQWETGEASGGVNGTGGTSAGAGFSNGDGNPAHFTQLAGSLQNGAFLDSNPTTGLATHGNSDPAVPGRYVYHIASGNQVSRANVCTPYYFVSVAGSGETPSSPDDRAASGETKAVYKGLTDNYHGPISSVTFYQTPYQALPTSVLGQNVNAQNFNHQFFDINFPAYLNSISDGYSQLTGYLDSINRTCAAQHLTPKIFLVGYSQGALVIHQYLLNIRSTDPVKPQIAFVGLIADPAAIKGRTELVNWGTASDANDYGVCHVAQNIAGVDACSTSNHDIPQPFQHITESLCDIGDSVCDTSEDTSGFIGGWKGKVQAGTITHTTYPAKEPSALENMGRSITVLNHMP
jgi:hypothetical protein